MLALRSTLQRGAMLAVLAACTGPAVVQAAPLTWTAQTLPADGNLAGAPGSTLGWGYTVSNEDPTLWLLMSAATTDSVANGTIQVLIDLPILAPGTSITVPYDGVQGLYALTWDVGAPLGFVNVGAFVLAAEWWDGDPLSSNGTLVGEAARQTLAYSAQVVAAVPNGIPEPSTWWLGLLALAAAGSARRLRAVPAQGRFTIRRSA